jgi:hypothetical protein
VGWSVYLTGARRLKLALHPVTVRQPEDLAAALAAVERAHVDALVWCLTFPDQPAVDIAARRRLPSVGCAASSPRARPERAPDAIRDERARRPVRGPEPDE